MKHGIGRTSAAVIISAAVNVLMLIMLAGLNGLASTKSKRPPDATPVLTLVKKDEQRETESPAPNALVPEPEIMTVDLDLPAPQPVDIEPVELELSVPDVSEQTVSVVAVAVESQAVERSATAAGREKDEPAAAPSSASRVDEPPREIDCAPPRYPQDALERGIEGRVSVRLLVNESGLVEDIRILRVEGAAAFRKAVLDVVPGWRFRPARHGGRPVKVWAVKLFRFELEE